MPLTLVYSLHRLKFLWEELSLIAKVMRAHPISLQLCESLTKVIFNIAKLIVVHAT